ncbi:MAG: efflux RND transporter periplasmic adaptor subunit [Gemmataceae bacterium]
MSNHRWFLAGTVMAGLLVGIGLARQDDNEATKTGKEQGSNGNATGKSALKVEKGGIKIEISLKGTIEAEKMIGLSIKPQTWAQPLTVKKALDHGTPVKKGDVLVEIDLEKIDESIRDLRVSRGLEELAIREAREELPIVEKTLPLDLAIAERAKKQADEDLKQFLEVDRAQTASDAELMVKSASFFLESAREELKQLQKMYRDKDLTEETEEIILRRQRFMVEMNEYFLKSAKITRDQVLKVQLPRREQSLRDNAEKQELTLEKAKNTLRPTISQKRLALEKLIYEFDKSGERLKDLERDRELLTVRAPADGIVYHGKCVRGQWATTTTEEAKLQPGGIVAPAEVFMTVVAQRPIFIRADVEEKHLHWLREGLKGKVVPAGYPDLKLSARLLKVSSVPRTAGHFDARFVLETKRDTQALMPGMACSIKLIAYQNKDALTVPTSAVFTDDGDDDVHYVYLVGGKNSKPEKRTVKIGKNNGHKTEILEGLKEGDEILPEDPNQRLSPTPVTPTPSCSEE